MSEFIFSSSHEGCRLPPDNEFEAVKSAYSIPAFQNGGIVSERGLLQVHNFQSLYIRIPQYF